MKMQITKFKHSCVLIDDGETKILFDPGLYGGMPELRVDGVVITHVHQDHLDINHLQALLKNHSPRIITNNEVKTELDKYGILCEVVEQGGSAIIGTLKLEAFGNEHAIIHLDLPRFQNTGYLINDKIFHPGDALFTPPKPVEVLLFPIVAPWSKVSETLDYIVRVKAKINFPIHDGFIDNGGAFYRFAKMWCDKNQLQFIEPQLNYPYNI